MTSRLLFVVFLVFARPTAGADVVKAAARDSAIRWQFDTHG